MLKLSPKGYINFLLVLILVIGLLTLLYLIKKPTNILPKAYESNPDNLNENTIITPNGKFGIAIDIKRKDKIPGIDQLNALSPGWIRFEYKSGYEIPTFPKDIKTLVIFDYVSIPDEPPWKGNSLDWSIYTNKYLEGLKQFIQQNADKFDAIEVWNEEDIGAECKEEDFYCPYVQPFIYANILKRAASVIKQYSPNTKVIMGGLGSHEITEHEDGGYLLKVIGADPHVFDQVDALGVHSYERTLNNWCSSEQKCSESLDGGDLKETMEKYRAVLPNHIKLWVTEIGHQTIDYDWQKEYLKRVFDYLQTQTEVIIWYAWTDIMSDGPWDANLGLYEKSGKIKPAGELFKTYSTSP